MICEGFVGNLVCISSIPPKLCAGLPYALGGGALLARPGASAARWRAAFPHPGALWGCGQEDGPSALRGQKKGEYTSREACENSPESCGGLDCNYTLTQSNFNATL